jgi:anti-anti-sigma regulatory factor
MLRITRVPGTDGVARLAVEGRVAGGAADELGRSCEAYVRLRHPLMLDLSAVTFIDPRGIRMLRGVLDRGAVLVGCSPFLSALLDERRGGT